MFVPPDAIYCAAPDVDWKYNLLPAADAVPKVIFPLDEMLTLSEPAVSNRIVSALGNLIAVLVSPVWTILSAISTSPVNVHVVPDTAPLNVPVVPDTAALNVPVVA